MFKLSVITVVYNSAKYIEDTILNVLELKKRNDGIEYIIVDGGSTDGTCEVIEKFSDKISCYISEPDKGIYDAMNKGAKLAQGGWLIFMNSGDLFHIGEKAYINELFSEVDNMKEYDIIYGNTLTKNERCVITIQPQEINRNFFFFNTICHQSVFFNKNIFNDLGYYNLDYKIIADKDLLFRVANSNGKFYHIDHIISVWDERGFSKENISLFEKEDKSFKELNFRTLERYYLLFSKTLGNLVRRIT
jgi:glycosyltransferase involved in cell wall biosynthesis